MLALDRKLFTGIRIFCPDGTEVTFKILRNGRNRARVGVEAPHEYRIARIDRDGNEEGEPKRREADTEVSTE